MQFNYKWELSLGKGDIIMISIELYIIMGSNTYCVVSKVAVTSVIYIWGKKLLFTPQKRLPLHTSFHEKHISNIIK